METIRTTRKLSKEETRSALILAVKLEETTAKVEGKLKARLKFLEALSTCGRCLGTGAYGPMQVHAGICFNCEGAGGSVPSRLTQEEVDAIAKAAEERLPEYFEENRKKAVFAKANDSAMKMWTATGISPRYEWRNAFEGSSTYTLKDAEYAAVNRKICAGYEAVIRAEELEPKLAALEAHKAICEAAIEEIAALDSKWAEA